MGGDLSQLGTTATVSGDDHTVHQNRSEGVPNSQYSHSAEPKHLVHDKTSVFSITNSRYAVSGAPQSDHANEDRHFVCSDGNWFNAFGVFDGHDGDIASSLACKYMKHFLVNELPVRVEDMRRSSNGTLLMEIILRECFMKTDGRFFNRIKGSLNEREDITKQLKGLTSYEAYMQFPHLVSRLQELDPLISGGTTAVVAVIVEDTLYTANTGDSRAVLVEESDDGKGTLVGTQLSVDHTVYNEDEMCRLLTIGLDRDELKREGRLGTQENTRCIGDYTIKDGYAEIESLSKASEPPGISIPSFKEVKITDRCRYLLLMSDGVYKSLENMQPPSSNYNYLHDLIGRISQARRITSSNSMEGLSKQILVGIEQDHYMAYQEHALVSVQSPMAVQCRKRDDMTLMIYSF